MMAVRCAALTRSASGGDATVTAPAPTRSAAAIAASRAAPVEWTGPETTTTWPREYLWAAKAGALQMLPPERRAGCGTSRA